jgi:hypothetical protein
VYFSIFNIFQRRAVYGAIAFRGIKLSALLKKPKDRMVYEYDFFDGCMHDIVLEEIVPPDAAGKYPICIAGDIR